MKIKIWNNTEYAMWYDKFDTYHDSLWRASPILEWENYVNEILKDTGTLHYNGIKFGEEYIEFNSEEDYIRFVLEWS